MSKQPTSTTTRAIFLKESDRVGKLAIGGGMAVVGAIMMHFLGGIGAFVVAGGLGFIVLTVVRGRKPVIVMEATTLSLFFGTPKRIPFYSISRLDQTPSNDVELLLTGGEKVLIPTSRLEEEDGTWLRRTLRKEVRLANT